MKLRRILLVSGAILLALTVFVLDLVRTSVELNVGGLLVLRDLLVVGALVLVYFFLEFSEKPRDETPVKKIGLILIATAIVAFVGLVVGLTTDAASFETKEGMLLPLGFDTIFIASFLGFLFGLFSLLVLRVLRDLMLHSRKKTTRRNLFLMTILMVATVVSAVGMTPLETSVLTTVLFSLSISFIVMNSFRLTWIVYLTKREKIFSLVYGFFLFALFTYLNIASRTGIVQQSLLYHSHAAREFVSINLIFGNVYFGMAFVSTLFHLPTAEAFERKTSEVTSLHNLSKLITQVFDFNELVDTVTSMTLQVCEARSCWLEIVLQPDDVPKGQTAPQHMVLRRVDPAGYYVQIVGMRNIQLDDIEALVSFNGRSLRDAVIEERLPLVVDDVGHDPRVKWTKKSREVAGSLVIVPLVSHTGLLGILYATKESASGFFKDDVEVISAFADQATIAIENSRLINRSLERERLLREMMLAQEMQKRLLPQTLPRFASVEVDAVSTPAFEVGGDYYDFADLGDDRMGIIVGDVSGKGVSAAFYMSEVKGIFQALSAIYRSPKRFLIKANEALVSSIDKRSFISLIYAILDLKSGILTLSRAGHCPMLLTTNSSAVYIRPSGMGLGLSAGPPFADAMEERSVQLHPGDVCVFYTDGITEARQGDEEFGYERLLECARRARAATASQIKETILDSIRSFTDNQPIHDDLTLVVLKWSGTTINAAIS